MNSNGHDGSILDRIKGGLIVSCQALPEEALHSSYIMSRMAYAAYLGGALGIRANTVEDIREIRKTVNLPVIGIIKRVYDDCPETFITPTMAEVDALVESDTEIIALDATDRPHPGGVQGTVFISDVRKKYPNHLLMADCSTVEEGIMAAKIGFDLIGTTLSGYTPYTKEVHLPNYDMIHKLAQESGKPVVAEGGIWTPEQLKAVLECGAYTAVVGTAITRPMQITRRFTEILK